MQYPWYQKANKTFIYVLLAQFIFGLIIGFTTDKIAEALIIGLFIVAFPLVLLYQKPYEALTRHSVAVGVQLATALHIHLSQGLTEIHFEIFSLLAILIFYRDWKVILTSVLVIAVHHILFFILQSQALGVYIFEEGHLALYILIIHALFAVIEGAVLMYIAKDSHDEAAASYAMSHSIHNILVRPGEFNLAAYQPNDLKELAEYNRLISSFKALIEQTKHTSNLALSASQNAVHTAEQINHYSGLNTDQVESISSSVGQMASANTDISGRAQDVSDSAQSAQNSTLEITQIIEASHNTIGELKHVITDTADSIQNLSTKCNKIEEVMTSITAISEQTNLLALNAAIESARAGEHGRGFAVVADEVRQLATKTRENAEGISEVVKSLINDAALSVNQMNDCITQVDLAVTQSESMSENAESVVASIKTVADNINSVATGTTEQVYVSDTIATSTVEMQNISKALADNINQTKNEINNLTKHISELDNELQKFSV